MLDDSAPFDLLPLQQAYWVGRTGYGPLGGNACHGYLEIDIEDLDTNRLQHACDLLVARHPMLRAVIDAGGRQRVLPEVGPFPLRYLAQDVDPAAVRDRMSHQVTSTDTWPLFDIGVQRQSDGTSRVYISFDILIADAQSFRVLAAELAALYKDPHEVLPAIGTTFHEYVNLVGSAADAGARETAWEYWRPRLEKIAGPPDLPLVRSVAELTAPRVTRRETRLAPEEWSALQRAAAGAGITPSTALLVAFSSALELWSQSPRFTLNVTMFDRQETHPDIQKVVGPFTSTILVEADRGVNEPAGVFGGRLQRKMWEALEHRAVSGVDLLREMQRERGASASFPYVYTFVDSDVEDFRSELAALGDVRFAVSQTPQVLVDCQIARSGDSLLLWWDAAEEAFPPGMVSDCFDAFVEVVHRLTDPAAWQRGVLAELDAVSRSRAAAESSGPVPSATMDRLVRDAATASPDGVAVMGAGQEMSTYDELWRRASAIAVMLEAEGVGRESLVGVAAERGVAAIAAMIAVLRVGAAYVPLDVTWPDQRIAQIVQAAGAGVVLSDRPLSVGPVRLLDLAVATADGARPAGATPGDHPEWPAADDVAYVIYTSGSTGEPKGVEIEHRSAVNTILDVNRRWEIGPQDRVLAVSSLGFDLSVWDVFGTLAAGGCIVVPPPGEGARDPAEWLRLLVEQHVTVWNSAPALMVLLVELAEIRGITLPGLRLALLSGDWIPVTLPDRLRAVAPGCEIVSLGGATEASIWSVAYPIRDVDVSWTSIPYGFPLTNQPLYVLSGTGEERPTGVAGDLAIGGVGVARGYRNAPELTAAGFVDHPSFGRLYRTGDLARRRADGCLEFLGRKDGQVKIDGHRVELYEVDAALTALPGVRAASSSLGGQPQGRRHIVSMVEVTDEATTPQELRESLGRRLPHYMVPSRIDIVTKLPLTENGKVDRTADTSTAQEADTATVPVPAAAAAEVPVEASPSPVEAHVLAWVHEVLGRSDVGPHDDLLRAGMDSVDMLRLAAVMEETLGFHPPHVAVARNPTVATVRRLFEENLLQRLLEGHRLGSPDDTAVQPTDVERGVL